MVLTNRTAEDNRIRELYEQGKTIREITQLEHVSPNRICSVLKIASINAREAEEVARKALILDTESEALRLFSIGKKPTEVAINLRISAADTLRLYKDFWKLEGHHTLVKMEEELGEDLSSLLKLHRKMRNEGMTEDEVIDISRAYREIPYISDDLKELKYELKKTHDQKERCINDLIILNRRYMYLERKNRELQNSNVFYQNLIDTKQNELTNLKSRLKDHTDTDNIDNNVNLPAWDHDFNNLAFRNTDGVLGTYSELNNNAGVSSKKKWHGTLLRSNDEKRDGLQ